MFGRVQSFLKRMVGLGPPQEDLFARYRKLKQALPFKLRHGETDQERKVEWNEIEAYLELPEDLIDYRAKPFFAKVVTGDEIFEICSKIGDAILLASYHGFEIRRNGRVIDTWYVMQS